MTKPEALRLATYVMAAFPRPEVTPETIEIYMANLLDLPYGETVEAVDTLLRTARFLPSIAEIRTAYTNQCFRKAGILTAEEAWGVVEWAFWKVGKYRAFPADTPGGPLLQRVVKTLGWQKLCQSENGVADRAHFFRTYEAFVARERDRMTRDPTAQLPGTAPALQLVPRAAKGTP